MDTAVWFTVAWTDWTNWHSAG